MKYVQSLKEIAIDIPGQQVANEHVFDVKSNGEGGDENAEDFSQNRQTNLNDNLQDRQGDLSPSISQLPSGMGFH